MAKLIPSIALVISAALLTSACAITKPAAPDHARLPTEQWTGKIGLEDAPQTIRLAAHADGLSRSQADALSAFAVQWASQNGGEVQILHPRDAAASRVGGQAANYLRQVGVGRLRLQATDAPPGSPVEIGYMSVQVSAPLCGQEISSYTANGANRVDANFGCAVTANKAVMAASAQDLVRQRSASPVPAAAAVEAVTRALLPPTGDAAPAAGGGTN